MVEFLYRPEPVIDQTEWAKALRKNANFALVLEAAAETLAGAEWDVDGIHSALSAAGDKAGVANLRDSQAPVRLSVTGRSVGPPLMESLVLLGRDKTLSRIRAGLARVQDAPVTG